MNNQSIKQHNHYHHGGMVDYGVECFSSDGLKGREKV